MAKVLLCEDEEDIRSFVVINLKRAGYNVLECASAEAALEIVLSEGLPDIAILDVTLPGMDGFSLCRSLRGKNSQMGIIMLTARSQEMDKINGFSSGADDYVVKPFSPIELVARVDALMRRIPTVQLHPGGSNQNQVKQGKFLLDMDGRRFFREGSELELTQVEFLLMKLFMESPGRAFSRDDILDRVWGDDYFGNHKTVDVNISRLRQKIGDTEGAKYIQTVRGYGYRWGSAADR